MEIGAIGAETLAELQRLARSRPRSGRASVAKAWAIRTLERLARGRPRAALPQCPSGWHPGPPEFEELDRIYLEEHPEVRQRMWAVTLVLRMESGAAAVSLVTLCCGGSSATEPRSPSPPL